MIRRVVVSVVVVLLGLLVFGLTRVAGSPGYSDSRSGPVPTAGCAYVRPAGFEVLLGYSNDGPEVVLESSLVRSDGVPASVSVSSFEHGEHFGVVSVLVPAGVEVVWSIGDVSVNIDPVLLSSCEGSASLPGDSGLGVLLMLVLAVPVGVFWWRRRMSGGV